MEANEGIDAARERAHKHLQPVIDGTRGIFGSRVILTELLSKAAGRDVSQHSVKRWLNDDPAKRQEPHLGIGLLIREVFDANREKICQPWNAAKRRKPRGKAKPKTKTTSKGK